jgi:hypothetical protein
MVLEMLKAGPETTASKVPPDPIAARAATKTSATIVNAVTLTCPTNFPCPNFFTLTCSSFFRVIQHQLIVASRVAEPQKVKLCDPAQRPSGTVENRALARRSTSLES